jgi:hypothetical protein
MTSKVLRLVGSGLFVVVATGCDGYLAIRGRVYASASADSSRIYVDEAFPNIEHLVPIDSAVVWVFQRSADQTSDTTRHVKWSQRALSGHCGFFSIGQSAPPWAFEPVIQVNRVGFKDAARRFRHDSSGSHRVLVVLATLSGAAINPRPRVPPCP